jgi:integrase
MRGTWGRMFQRGDIWWVSYYVNGKERRESTKSDQPAAARRLLKQRRKQVDGNCYVGPSGERLTVDELLDAYVMKLENKGAKSLKATRSHLKPVRAYFALTRAVQVNDAAIQNYIKTRLDAKKARATVNRELEALRSAYRRAVKSKLLVLAQVPSFDLLNDKDNARQGFFEHADFLAVVEHLPDPVNDIAWFAYLAAWRRGEILQLQWDAVDRSAREVKLWTSKNGSARKLPLDGELWTLIERRWTARQVQMKDGTTMLSAYVFHRKGEPVVDFKKRWAAACKAAHLPGKLFHDFRRTAVRNMVRAGVPQSVAMSISGHKTASMFERYNISSTADQVDALKKTAAYLAEQPTKKSEGADVVEMPAKAAS